MTKRVKISSGENLKSIRKELGLRQREIVGDDVTRNLISMIENNKTPLSYNLAIVISDNINKISEERNIDTYIDPEDIMDASRLEAKKKVDQYIEELKEHMDKEEYDLSEEYIKELESLLNQWKITDKKVIVYELLGKIAYLTNNLEYEYMYLSKALENYFITPVKKDIYILISRLMENCIHTEKYNEGIRLSGLVVSNNIDIPKEYRVKICYNKALAYKNIGLYSNALETLDLLWKDCGKDYKDFIKTLILQCDCYSEKGDIDKAIEKYEDLAEMEEVDCGELGLIYIKLMNLFKDKNLREEVVKYRNKLTAILSFITENNDHLVKIYLTIAEVNEYLDNIELSEIHYIKAMNEAIEKKDKSGKVKALLSLMNMYIRTNQAEKIISRQKMIKESFIDAKLSNEMKLALKLISVSIQSNRDDKAEDIINDLVNR